MSSAGVTGANPQATSRSLSEAPETFETPFQTLDAEIRPHRLSGLLQPLPVRLAEVVFEQQIEQGRGLAVPRNRIRTVQGGRLLRFQLSIEWDGGTKGPLTFAFPR